METMRIRILENGRNVLSEEFSEPIELGREQSSVETLYRALRSEGRLRIPIAAKHEAAVARKQLLVEPLPDGRVRLTNASPRVGVRMLHHSGELPPAASRDVDLPVTLRIGARDVRLDVARYESLPESVRPPGTRAGDRSVFETFGGARGVGAPAHLPHFQAILDVHAAASPEDSFRRATAALVELFPLGAGRVLLWEAGQWRVKCLAAAPHRAALSAGNLAWTPSRRVLASVRDEKKTFWRIPSHLESLALESLGGIEALVAAPILDRQGEVIGVLYGERDRELDQALPPGIITEVQAKLVQLLAAGVATVLAQTALAQMESELKIGREMQRHFLPAALPAVPGWRLAAHFRPARHVSGDFYDAFLLPGGQLAVVAADVCDKGVGSALYMALFRSLLRAFAEQATEGCDPELPAAAIAASAVQRTNAYVAQTHADSMFCTAFFGLVETERGVLSYVNAGHEAPAVLAGGEVKSWLSRTGPAIGIRRDARYEARSLLLAPGDTLFAYTDGVTESRNGAGQFFTLDRLLPLLRAPAATAADLIDHVTTCLDDFLAGSEPDDDVTMLALRRMDAGPGGVSSVA